MPSDDQEPPGHEEILEGVLRHLLAGEACDLEDLCAEADQPALYDNAGQPAYVKDVRSYHDAGVLTLDRGLMVELSDGAEIAITILLNRRPHDETSVHHPD